MNARSYLALAIAVCGACGAIAPAPRAPVQGPLHVRRGHVNDRDHIADNLARELAWMLRVTPTELLPQAAEHGLFVLDIETNDVRTVCSDAAVVATEPWSTLLADPARDPARCFVAANEVFACTQSGHPGEPLLALRFVHSDRWQLVGAIVGVPQTDAWAAKVDVLDAKVDSVACP